MRDLIAAAARTGLRLLRRDERGTVGVLIAILVAGGVLLGMGAVAVDVGRVYQGRAELQNGADAAALAVARSCAYGGACTNAAGLAVSGSYVSGNASVLTTGTAAAGQVCGSGSLGTCTPTGAMVSCPANPAGSVNYVDVNTAASVSPIFSEVLGFGSATVKACAQAEWGSAQLANTIALTISVCQWYSLTQNGGVPWNTNVPVYLKGNGVVPCSGPAGSNIPGGFGWLCITGSGSSCNGNSGSSNCQGIIDLATSTSYSDPGTSPPSGCSQLLQQLVTSGSVVYVPVFSTATGSGNGNGGGSNSGTYHIIGLAAFVVVGYTNLPGGKPKDFGTYNLCTGNNPCLEGHFTQALVPLSSLVGPGTDFGATAVVLTG